MVDLLFFLLVLLCGGVCVESPEVGGGGLEGEGESSTMGSPLWPGASSWVCRLVFEGGGRGGGGWRWGGICWDVCLRLFWVGCHLGGGGGGWVIWGCFWQCPFLDSTGGGLFGGAGEVDSLWCVLPLWAVGVKVSLVLWFPLCDDVCVTTELLPSLGFRDRV